MSVVIVASIIAVIAAMLQGIENAPTTTATIETQTPEIATTGNDTTKEAAAKEQQKENTEKSKQPKKDTQKKHTAQTTPKQQTQTPANNGNSSTGGGQVLSARFPTRSSAGVAAGWSPAQVITENFDITTDGAVLQNVRVSGAHVRILADNVTIRNAEFINGAGISTIRRSGQGNACARNALIANVTFRTAPADWLVSGLDATVIGSGFTLRNVLMDGVYEGVRSGNVDACANGNNPVIIEKSYIRAAAPPLCVPQGWDWHGDAFQGYSGVHTIIRDTVLTLEGEGSCGGNSPFFYPNQGNTSVSVDGLIVRGGGFPFRLGAPGTIKDLYIVNNSWYYGSAIANCSWVTAGWDAHLVTLDSKGQPIIGVAVPCGGQIAG